MHRLSPLALSLLVASACSARGGTSGPITEEDVATTADVPAADVAAADVPSADAPGDVATPPSDVSSVDQPAPQDAPEDRSAADVPVTTDEGPRCASDGECSGSTWCDFASGMCMPIVCTPGRTSCVSNTRARVCNSRGSMFTEMDCTDSCVDGVCRGGMMMCSAPMTLCGSACVNTQLDVSNCGACGRACASGQTCNVGVCMSTSTCSAPLVSCGGRCVSIQTDVSNCGGCDRSCSAGQTCAAGVCTGGACAAPLVRCGTACVDTTSDVSNCGVCARACASGQACRAGACVTSMGTSGYTRSSLPSTTPFVDVCAAPGSSRVLPSIDDSSVLAPLPFTFQFWGMPLPTGRMVNISSNGFISLDGTSSASLSGTIPSAAAPNGVIAAWWRDLRTGTSGVCHATMGASPARVFGVEWVNTALYSGTGTITTEILLNEADGAVSIFTSTYTMASTTIATVGMEDLVGMRGVSGCAVTTAMCTNAAGTRTRFTPSP